MNVQHAEERSSDPTSSALYSRIQALLDDADVKINGDRPWDPQVHEPALFARVLRSGSLGFAEAYMDGWWDCERLDEMFTRLIGARLHLRFFGLNGLRLLASALWNMLLNPQKASRAFEVGEVHYDIGNDLYKRMLDPTMSYSCGYWREATDLESAQRAKLDLICRKLELQPGERLLDIGCGWGGLAEHAARHYGAEVTGVTVSEEQQKLARQRCEGLPVNIELTDYRDLEGRFDKAVSVGMFEHVGPKNYATYFDTVRRLLSDEGLHLLHSIGEERTSMSGDPFIDKYIFPNGKIASRKHLNDATLGRFRLEDWHNFGPDYDRTLMAWASNFERAWPEIAGKYSRRFYRMWRYYLYSCAGYFRSRRGQLWQVVLAPPERRQAYLSVR